MDHLKPFLLNPRNEPFVNGERRYPASMSGGFGCATAVFIVFFIAGLFIVFFSLNALWENLLLVNRVETIGQVIGNDYKFDEGDVYTLIYQFDVNNTTYTRRQQVSAELYNRYPPGQAIPVEYAATDARTSRIAGTSSLGFDLFLGAFSLCWTGAVTVFGISLFTSAQRQRRMRRAGQLVFGTLTTITGEKDSDGDFQIEVTVRFDDPHTGQTISGKRRGNGEHLAQTALPQAGTPTAIFFLNARDWDVL
ncbi:MAG: hypothetical protein HXY40_17845 [Chloroflexi bacterium]|nr:hypothetical protein [Chloroflexota bacterium]